MFLHPHPLGGPYHTIGRRSSSLVHWSGVPESPVVRIRFQFSFLSNVLGIPPLSTSCQVELFGSSVSSLCWSDLLECPSHGPLIYGTGVRRDGRTTEGNGLGSGFGLLHSSIITLVHTVGGSRLLFHPSPKLPRLQCGISH